MSQFPPVKRGVTKGARDVTEPPRQPRDQCGTSLHKKWWLVAPVGHLYRPMRAHAIADDVVVNFVRSQGAGGQNVNKGTPRRRRQQRKIPAACDSRRRTASACAVNTKADLRFNVAKADFLPQWIKDVLVEQARRMQKGDGKRRLVPFARAA